MNATKKRKKETREKIQLVEIGFEAVNANEFDEN